MIENVNVFPGTVTIYCVIQSALIMTLDTLQSLIERVGYPTLFPFAAFFHRALWYFIVFLRYCTALELNSKRTFLM